MKLLLLILFSFAASKIALSQSITIDSTVWTFIVKPELEYSANIFAEKSVKVINSDYKSFVSSIYLYSPSIPKIPFQSRKYLVKGKVFTQDIMVLGIWGPTWVTRMYLQPISVKRYLQPEGN